MRWREMHNKKKKERAFDEYNITVTNEEELEQYVRIVLADLHPDWTEEQILEEITKQLHLFLIEQLKNFSKRL